MERVTATLDSRTLDEILGLLDALDAELGAPSDALRAEIDAEARRIFSR